MGTKKTALQMQSPRTFGGYIRLWIESDHCRMKDRQTHTFDITGEA